MVWRIFILNYTLKAGKLMSIERDIFNRYIINRNKLLQYGFKNDNNKLIFHQKIMDDSFDLIVEYYNNSIKGKIIEISLNEEYTNFRINMIGEFNQKVKNEFENVLLDIRNKCCERQNFIYEQSNRINEYIKSMFETLPEFLWDKYPNYAVYRNKNNKWFSIIIDIQMNKIEKKGNDDTIIEIINVKINPECKNNLLKIKGIYETYHMNKKSWISIVLNDTLPDEKIFELISDSYNMIAK